MNSTTPSANASLKASETRRRSEDDKVKKEEKSSGKEGGDFSRELSAAAAPQSPPQAAVADKAATNALLSDSSKKFSLASSAERSPMTRTSAASLNAASVVTGLKPWSREWVFEGNDPIAQAAGTRSKPLFGEGSEDAPVLDAAAAAALTGTATGAAALSGKRGDAGAKSDAQAPDAAATAKTGQQAGTAARGAEAPNVAPDASSLLKQTQAAAQAGSAGAAAGESALLPGLAALNGEILAADALGGDSGANPATPQPTQLSGADFMSALAATRMGARDQSSSNLSGDSGQGGGGFGGQAGKGNFRAIDSLKKPTTLPGREEAVLLAGVEPLRTGNYHVIQPTQIDGRVTQGAMTRNRLTSEALLNMSNGITSFAGQGGGEMRVRLKPDSLGELNLRVSTRGNEVRLQIQATDEKARKILEESLPHLKDKLASQNLNLGRVEVSTLAQQGSGVRQDDQSQNQNQNMHQQHSMNDWMGQSQQGRSGQSSNPWRDNDSSWDPDLRAPKHAARPSISGLTATSATSSGGLEPGRLDVRA